MTDDTLPQIEISIELGCEGDSINLGLVDLHTGKPTFVPTDADDMLRYIKEDCNGNFQRFLDDWGLLGDFTVRIAVRRPDTPETTAEWVS